MYLTSVLNRTYFHCRLLRRGVNRSNYDYISKANIFTRDAITLTGAKYPASIPKRSELKTIQSKYESTRRLLVDNLLKRVTNTLAADLRRRSVRQLFNGNPSPFFALVGISLASGTGLLGHDEELNGVCWEIREAIFRMKNNLYEEEENEFDGILSVDSLEFGSVIAKGSYGIVYEARERSKADIVEALHSLSFRMDVEKVNLPAFDPHRKVTICSYSNSMMILFRSGLVENLKDEESTKTDDFPLAVKMMFNYDVESNSTAILRSMCRELVPLQSVETSPSDSLENNQLMSDRIQRLPPHINIVKMLGSFTDYVPELPDSKTFCPNALPQRLDPQGFGRNMSLFLVMKKYNTDLKQYVSKKVPRARDCVLLLTQLLEAVSHINKHGIAHRRNAIPVRADPKLSTLVLGIANFVGLIPHILDVNSECSAIKDLKSDNILLDTSDGDENCPLLAVTDFGSCLSDKHYGLNLPYQTPDVDRGGNTALMAPEVVTARAGMFASIDYSKADVWAAGTLAYEIFSGTNPFFRHKNQATEVLRNTTYSEEMLPELPNEVPPLIARLIRNLLTRNPARRLDAETAATICQVYLWAPSQWLLNEKLPSNTEILQWLLSLTTKVLYEGSLVHKRAEERRPSITEYHLIATFLLRIRLSIVRRALDWICHSS